MNVVYILLPVALLIALGYLVLFIISVRKGQYDDTTTPAVRMLFDDDEKKQDGNEEAEQPR